MKKCFVFCHGFGFDATFWENIRPYFAQERCVYVDLGYFGKENIDIPQDVELIGIGHSFGFRWLNLLNSNFTMLVGLQGFVHFLGGNQRVHSQRKPELEMFKEQFSKAPKGALQRFYRRCGVPVSKEKLERLDKGRLLKDLESMSIEVRILAGVPMLIVGSKDDPVVPPELIYDNFVQHENVKISIIENGSHCLGYCEPQLVYRKTMDFVYGRE